MTTRAAMCLVLLSACFSKPPAPEARTDDGGTMIGNDGRTGETDASGGGGPDAAPQPGCSIHDDFNSGTGCGTWGQAAGSGQIARVNQQLAADPGSTGDAYCISGQFIPANTNTTIEIVTAPSGDGRYATFSLDESTRSLARVELYRNNGVIALNTQCNGVFATRTFDSDQPWYRIELTGSQINIYQSTDRTTFGAVISTCLQPTTLLPVKIQIGGGDEGFATNSGSLVFDNLDCQ